MSDKLITKYEYFYWLSDKNNAPLAEIQPKEH